MGRAILCCICPVVSSCSITSSLSEGIVMKQLNGKMMSQEFCLVLLQWFPWWSCHSVLFQCCRKTGWTTENQVYVTGRRCTTVQCSSSTAHAHTLKESWPIVSGERGIIHQSCRHPIAAFHTHRVHRSPENGNTKEHGSEDAPITGTKYSSAPMPSRASLWKPMCHLHWRHTRRRCRGHGDQGVAERFRTGECAD